MATIRVRSTDGSDGDNGTTWALAKATLLGAAAIDAAGDTVYVSQAHSESNGSAATLAFAGTIGSPVNILCVNDGADPPTAQATTAVFEMTVSNKLSITGNVNVEGIIFNLGTSTGGPIHELGGSGAEVQKYKNCQFNLTASGNLTRLDIGSGGSTGPSWIEFTDVSISASAAGQSPLGLTGVNFKWRGGSVLSGSTALTGGMFGAPGYKGKRAANALVDGVDLTNLGVASFLFKAVDTSIARGIIRNCKLPAWTTGGLVTGAMQPGARFELWNCDSADTHYRMSIAEYGGTIDAETTIVRTGGATDGTTPFSWKYAMDANATRTTALASPEQFLPNATTGSSITVAAEVVTDGVTLKESDCWLEVEYLGTSGTPLALFATDGETNTLKALAGTSSNQTTSTEAWTTTGLGSPTKQKLSVTFTPQEAGVVIARVMVAKASATIYVDPPQII